LAFVVAAVAAWVGLRAMAGETATAFQSPPYVVFPEMNEAVRVMRANLPADAPLFYIMDRPQPWLAGVWQRACYPNPVFLLESADELELPANRAIRAKYGVRYALSVGDPPVVKMFRWFRMLPSVPASYPAAYGELNP